MRRVTFASKDSSRMYQKYITSSIKRNSLNETKIGIPSMLFGAYKIDQQLVNRANHQKKHVNNVTMLHKEQDGKYSDCLACWRSSRQALEGRHVLAEEAILSFCPLSSFLFLAFCKKLKAFHVIFKMFVFSLLTKFHAHFWPLECFCPL